MSRVSYNKCDICGRKLLKHEGDKQCRLRAKGGWWLNVLRSYGGGMETPHIGEVEVCGDCWDRIKEEVIKARRDTDE